MNGGDLIGFRDQARGRDHVCFAFGEPVEFRQAVRSFLAEGLAAGYRVVAVVSRAGEEESWRRDEVLGPALANGQAEIVLSGPAYGEAVVVDPFVRVGLCQTATEQALNSGFKGLRIAADVTSSLDTPAGVDAYAHYEYLVDRYIAASSMSGLCGYDRGVIREPDLAQMACLHPSANTEAAAPFRLYTGPDGGCVIAGYLDFNGLELLRSTLERTRLPDAGHLPIDASRLEFVDHNSMLALEAAARSHSATVVLRSRAPHLRHLAELLELTAVRVEVAG